MKQTNTGDHIPASSDGKNGARQPYPSFQIYPADYLTSEKVACMGWEERGVYMHMLLMSWLNQGVSKDKARLSRLLGIEEARLSKMFDGPLGDCWVEEGDRLVNPRLERERERLVNLSIARSDAGKKGGRPKKSTKQLVSVAKANGKQTESPQHSTTQHNTAQEEPPLPPKGKKKAKPKKTVDPVEILDQEFPGLDVANHAMVWSGYRKEAGIKPYTAATWRSQFKKAQEDPALWIESVEFSIAQGYQGIFAPKGQKADKPKSAYRLSDESEPDIHPFPEAHGVNW